MWLVSVVVRRYMYYRYPHNNYYFPTTALVLTLFFAVYIIPISLFIFKCFLYLYNIIIIHILGRDNVVGGTGLHKTDSQV